jgi:hypothetical protein
VAQKSIYLATRRHFRPDESNVGLTRLNPIGDELCIIGMSTYIMRNTFLHKQDTDHKSSWPIMLIAISHARKVSNGSAG